MMIHMVFDYEFPFVKSVLLSYVHTATHTKREHEAKNRIGFIDALVLCSYLTKKKMSATWPPPSALLLSPTHRPHPHRKQPITPPPPSLCHNASSSFSPSSSSSLLLPLPRRRAPRLHHHLLASTPRLVVSNAVLSNPEQAQPVLSPEEEDQAYVQQILRVLDLLQNKRDMSFNEIRLTVMIEDPREVERRKELGIEDERGCSREDLAAALVDVYEGRIPSDRLVLRELAKDMLSWPNLEDEIDERTSPLQSPYAKVTDTGVDPRLAARRAKIDWDAAAEIEPGEEEKDIGEKLPPAVGFSVLYLFSAIPIFIGVAVVIILFLNSLQ